MPGSSSMTSCSPLLLRSKRDGIAVAFLMELKYIVVEKPDGYNKEDAAALLASYDTNDTESATHTPNIIVIMNEAFL